MAAESYVTHQKMRLLGILLLVADLAVYAFLVTAANRRRQKRKNHEQEQRLLDTNASSDQGIEDHSNRHHKKDNSVSSSCRTIGAPISNNKRDAESNTFNEQVPMDAIAEDLEEACTEYAGSSSCFSPHFYTNITPPAFITEDVQL